MNDLVVIKNDVAVCDSLLVAERFHKKHKNVVQTVERLAENSADVRKMFSKSTYKDSYDREQKFFFMNRDGFSILAMGFTGKDALQWKLDYIKAFNAMENLLTERQTLQWQQARAQSKVVRKNEGAAINDFVECARSQGSKNADKYFCNLSRLANKTAGIIKRDTASAIQLNLLIVIENMFDQIIREGMKQGTYYKDIFQMCKLRAEMFKEIVKLDMTA